MRRSCHSMTERSDRVHRNVCGKCSHLKSAAPGRLLALGHIMRARLFQPHCLGAILLGAGVLIACGTTSGAQSASGACPQGMTLCPTCNGDPGFCASACTGGICNDLIDGAVGDEPSPTVTDAGSSPSDAGASPADAGGCDACGAGQLCVHPSCGGGTALPCYDLNDAGGCATGWTYSTVCQFYGGTATTGPGCRPPPCIPPPPFCVDVPTACGTTAKCACLPDNVCQVTLPGNVVTGGQCLSVSGPVVSCGSA
jgi:hypothetical protein